MSDPIDDRRSLFLLLSLLLIILLSPFLETHRAGEFFLLIALFATLTIAVLELHGKRTPSMAGYCCRYPDCLD
jgi:hypothetical protein